MNRKLKFRAWDKDSNRMIYQESQSGENTIGYDVSVIIGFDNYAYLLKEDEHGNKCLIETGELIPMQFTGLLDRNGKEIYEGDIVGYGDNYPCEVKWSNDEYAWEVVEYGNDDGVRRHTLTAYTVPFIVLGNVYETPKVIMR